jgi:hypothetical protein
MALQFFLYYYFPSHVPSIYIIYIAPFLVFSISSIHKKIAYAVADEEKVMEVQRKRHYGPNVSLKGRVSKLGKLDDVSDDGSDGHPPRKFLDNVVPNVYGTVAAKVIF